MICRKECWDDFACDPILKHDENDDKGGKLFLVIYYASMFLVQRVYLGQTFLAYMKDCKLA